MTSAIASEPAGTLYSSSISALDIVPASFDDGDGIGNAIFMVDSFTQRFDILPDGLTCRHFSDGGS